MSAGLSPTELSRWVIIIGILLTLVGSIMLGAINRSELRELQGKEKKTQKEKKQGEEKVEKQGQREREGKKDKEKDNKNKEKGE